jgi:predicted alpha/beta hydrolase family esterase
MRRWAEANPDYHWAPEPPGPPLILKDRVAALHQVISEDNEPAVLIAHSAGCITTVVWAARFWAAQFRDARFWAAQNWADRHAGPVRAALLVTPPMIDGFEPADPSDIPWLIPRAKLPFPAIVVASRTDPYTTFAQFEQLAADWGAELFDAGDVGHLDSATGFGPWPDGERLLSERF